MVQSVIDISSNLDRVLNIVKAQHGFKNKSQALELILNVYSESFLEPELRPEFIARLEKIKKEKGIPFKDVNELRKIIEE